MRKIILVLMVCSLVAPVWSVLAAPVDVFRVTLTGPEDAALFNAAGVRVFTRVDNTLLAAADSIQIAAISRSGMELEVLYHSTSLDRVQLLQPTCAHGHDEAPAEKAAGAISFAGGLALTTMDKSDVRSFTESNEHFAAVPLEDLDLGPVEYFGEAVTLAFSPRDSYVEDTLAQYVLLDSLRYAVVRLQRYNTRYIWTDSIDIARDWLVQRLQQFGYTDVRVEPFWWQNDWHYNVVAFKPGTAEPEKVIVIGGHYDSITYGQQPGPMTYAPGADDNGSGTALMLEVARVLAEADLRKSVMFIAYSAEEVGLIGSRAHAAEALADGMDIEVMLNYDMVAYDPAQGYGLDVSATDDRGSHGMLAFDTYNRVTAVTPVSAAMESNSDHYAYAERGFNVVNHIENNFNQAGWHTNLDLYSRLNFAYFAEVAKGAAVTTAIIANSASAPKIKRLVDVGDGQSIYLELADCPPGYTYTVLWREAGQPFWQGSSVLPPETCEYMVSGLDPGQTYSFSVTASHPDLYPALTQFQKSATPQWLPVTPRMFTVQGDLGQISLHWLANEELDFSHYRIYRGIEGIFTVLVDNLTDTTYADIPGNFDRTIYSYYAVAVDQDGNESPVTDTLTAAIATFDGGNLIVDETDMFSPIPSQEAHEAFFDTLFGSGNYDLTEVVYTDTPVSRTELGFYENIYWIDDDLFASLIEFSNDSIDWYTQWSNTDFFVCGYRTTIEWTDPIVSSSHVAYREFGLSEQASSMTQEFIGAKGEKGFPSLTVAPHSPHQAFGRIPVYVPRPGAEVIYRFDSNTDNPAREDQPVGLLYRSENGVRIILGFPIYYMSRPGVIDMIARVREIFGDSPEYVPGDVNRDGSVDVADVTFLVEYSFFGGSKPLLDNTADVNGDCFSDVADVVYLVEHVFGDPSGPAPVPGCVH